MHPFDWKVFPFLFNRKQRESNIVESIRIGKTDAPSVAPLSITLTVIFFVHSLHWWWPLLFPLAGQVPLTPLTTNLIMYGDAYLSRICPLWSGCVRVSLEVSECRCMLIPGHCRPLHTECLVSPLCLFIDHHYWTNSLGILTAVSQFDCN